MKTLVIGTLDLANGVDGISCPNDTFETASVFDVSYKD